MNIAKIKYNYNIVRLSVPFFLISSVNAIAELVDVWLASSLSTENTAFIGFLYRLFFFYGAFQIAFTSSTTIRLNKYYSNGKVHQFYSYLLNNVIINLILAFLFSMICYKFRDSIFSNLPAYSDSFLILFLIWIFILSILSPFSFAIIAIGYKSYATKVSIISLSIKVASSLLLFFKFDLGLNALIIGTLISIVVSFLLISFKLIVTLFKDVNIRDISLRLINYKDFLIDSSNLLWSLSIGTGFNLLLVSLMKENNELLAIYNLYFSFGMIVLGLFTSSGTYFSLEMAKLNCEKEIEKLKVDIYEYGIFLSVIVIVICFPVLVALYSNFLDISAVTSFVVILTLLSMIFSGYQALLTRAIVRALRYTSIISKVSTKTNIAKAISLLPLLTIFGMIDDIEVYFFTTLLFCLIYAFSVTSKHTKSLVSYNG